ncbi:Spermidine N(1)-acetyltransferase [Nocardia farcinica]|nr:Spermidine N(1)-acetyltransferase [Nocardia farcinica]
MVNVRLRALEREDLPFVHQLSNDAQIMSYWFDEPFEALVECRDIYDRHIHDERERRFIVDADGAAAGLVELVEIAPGAPQGRVPDHHRARSSGPRAGDPRHSQGARLRLPRY